MALAPRLADAHRALGDVLVRQGRREEAIEAYEASLKATLAGHKPLAAPILTSGDEDQPLDPDHFFIHARLADLYASTGAAREAINGYRMSIAGGYDGFVVRSRLALLYWGEALRQKAVREAWQAVKLIPADLRNVFRRFVWRCRRAVRAGRHAWLRAPDAPAGGAGPAGR